MENTNLKIGDVLVNKINFTDYKVITRVNDKTYNCGYTKVYKHNLQNVDYKGISYQVADDKILKFLELERKNRIINEFKENIDELIKDYNEFRESKYFNFNEYAADFADVVRNLIEELNEVENEN